MRFDGGEVVYNVEPGVSIDLLPETVAGTGSFVKDGAGQLLFRGGHDASTLIKAGRLTLGSGSNLADSSR